MPFSVSGQFAIQMDGASVQMDDTSNSMALKLIKMDAGWNSMDDKSIQMDDALISMNLRLNSMNDASNSMDHTLIYMDDELNSIEDKSIQMNDASNSMNHKLNSVCVPLNSMAGTSVSMNDPFESKNAPFFLSGNSVASLANGANGCTNYPGSAVGGFYQAVHTSNKNYPLSVTVNKFNLKAIL